MTGLSITYQPWGQTLAELADAGKRAEAAGAEVLWASELHRSAVGTAAALAQATATAKIGTSIALAFPRSPMITALEALDLDEISGGRFVLGLGSGVQRLNEEWHNVNWGKPIGHMTETVRNIRQFWRSCTTGEAIELEGDYEPMHIRGYERPFHVERTDIPIYLAAMGPVMTRLAGTIGNGWISHELCSPSYLTQRILPELAIGIGRTEGKSRDNFDVVVSVCCSVDPDPEAARRRVAGLVGFYASVRTYADFFDFHGLADQQQKVIDGFRSGLGADYLGELVSNEMVDALTMAGTRESVAERITRYEGKADSVKLSPPTHGIDPSETRTAQNEIISMIREITGGRR